MEHKTGNIKREEKSHASAADAWLSRPSFAPCSMLHVPCSAGFSIVETIVAIAILSLAVVAPLTLAERGLSSSVYARDQVTAFYLVQEAVEFIRNIRDGNNLSGANSWLKGLDNTGNTKCFYDKGCGIDVTASVGQQVIDCSTDVKGCQMTFDPSTGVYGERRNGNGSPQNGWQDSIFTRVVKITPVSINGKTDEADIVAEVSWQSGKIARKIDVDEKIFNWFPIKQ